MVDSDTFRTDELAHGTSGRSREKKPVESRRGFVGEQNRNEKATQAAQPPLSLFFAKHCVGRCVFPFFSR
jgi:hypothetical protein